MPTFTWLNAVTAPVYLVGLAVAVWAYRVSKRPGYLVIAAYFVVAICTWTVLPGINAARFRAWESRQPPPTEADEGYNKDVLALSLKYYPPSRSHRPGPPRPLHVGFPFGPILLVTGLWLLARREPRKEAQSVTGANPG